MSKSLFIFILLNIYGDIRCVNLIDGNDFLAYNKVTLISPIGLEVKLKKISGHKMSPDWQFTSNVSKKKCAVCGENTFIAWENNHAIDFEGATVIDKGNYRVRKTLESWHTAKTVGADNNSKPLPRQYSILL